MIRILLEISLPSGTLKHVEAALSSSALPRGVTGNLGLVDTIAGCQSPARGGGANWTPCWISLATDEPKTSGFARVVQQIRETLVEAAGVGGLKLLALPAAVQIGDRYHRFGDILDVLEHLS